MPDAQELCLTVTVPKVVPSVHLFSLIVTRSCHQSLCHSCIYIPVGGKKTKNKQPKTKQQQKNSLKIGEPCKTSQEITQICLEVYNLNFDMTIINQFSQLCSRLAHEKDIILLDCFRLNQHTIAKPGFACGESYYRYFAKYTITPFS